MSPRSRLVVALVSTVLIGYIAVGSLLGRVLGDTSYGQLAVFNEVVRMVLDAYVEPVNVERAMAGARQGLTDALDGDSAYLDPEELRAYQQTTQEGEAELGLVITRRFSFVMVVAARPGSPAEKAGLRPGDLIRSIDERHTRQLPAVAAERLLRGAAGSSLRLGILRAGADPFELTVVRERIMATAPQGRLLDGSLGYLKVSDFTAETGDDARAEVEALRRAGASRLVLDLRGAAWGGAAEGAKLAEVFVKGGPVAKLVGRGGDEQLVQADPAHSAWLGPLAVLIDNGTAGPGEVAAAALADTGRAKLVGERSFGRTGVSRVVPLPEGGLLVTVAKYASPKGTAIHLEGLKPTVVVEGRGEEDAEPGAPSRPDPILEKAIEMLRADAAKAG
jgi:carboxyl-terminal processing protease